MPEAFSPSRSLKYWRMTLRTVDESSLSRPSVRSVLCLGCNGDLVFIRIFELARVLQQAVEEFGHGGQLQVCVVERIHPRAEHRGVLESLGVPADVLPGHARAALVAIESVEVVQVADQDLADLLHFRPRQVLAGCEEVLDLAEDPRPTLGGAPDHDRV